MRGNSIFHPRHKNGGWLTLLTLLGRLDRRLNQNPLPLLHCVFPSLALSVQTSAFLLLLMSHYRARIVHATNHTGGIYGRIFKRLQLDFL